ncbi:MAG: metallophosphoesterase family protein [Pseudomonadota bacterium]
MRLGLISDTHITTERERIPPQIREIFEGVDLILHAGDIYLLSVLDELEVIAPVLAARGNGDIRLPHDPRLQDNIVLDLFGMRIGVTHGIDYPEPAWRTLEAAMDYEFRGRVDVLIFGDSHVDLLEVYNDVFLINPGSPNFPRQIQGPGSVVLLEIDSGGKARAEIISLVTGRASKSLTRQPETK